MGQSAAKQGDRITATDTHQVQAPNGAQTPTPMPFSGLISGGLSTNVKVMGRAAATVNSTASNIPPHLIVAPSFFPKPPSNRGTIKFGSATVKINGKAAARNGDKAETCNDPKDLPVGQVVATGSVRIG